MKKITISLMAMITALILNCPPLAAGEAQPAGSSSQQAARQASRTQSARALLGMKVVSPQGEEIGQIEDIRLNTSAGRIDHLTMTKGRAPGLGGHIPVPLAAFRFDAQSGQAILTVDKSMLDNAPQQATMSDDDFSRELQSYYGVSPAWEWELPLELPELRPTGRKRKKTDY